MQFAQAEAAGGARDYVVAAVGEAFRFAQDRAAADAVHVVQTTDLADKRGAQGDHAELVLGDVAGHQVRGELPVARFEDVQRQVRSGEQHGLQREQRQGRRSAGALLWLGHGVHGTGCGAPPQFVFTAAEGASVPRKGR
ncbi:hypothetical protein A4R44_01772 [Amycolatopsis sp. M39]|nr:hypothetical protein A4R44_01772 [Amycolatopsis sp. M39]